MTGRRWVALFVAIAVLAGLGIGGYLVYRELHQRLTPQVCTVTVDGTSTTLSQEQAANASIIVAAAVARGLPERAAIIGLMTAYQESGLRNLDYGDRDSLGLFQQRPSQGWGTEEQIQDPWYSSDRFYKELEKFKNWQKVDLNDMAQKVQRSGYPLAYGKHAAKATAVAKSLLGAPGSISCVSFSVGDANPDAFTPVFKAIDADYSVEGDTVRLTGTESKATWSAANMAMANSYSAGLAKASVLGKVWNAYDGVWTDGGANDTATLTLGAS